MYLGLLGSSLYGRVEAERCPSHARCIVSELS